MKNMKLTSIAKTCLIMTLLGVTQFNTGWSQSIEDKVKEWVDNSAHAAKRGVDNHRDTFDSIQEYLDDYKWKGMVENKVTFGFATLKHLKLNDNAKAIVVRPGEKIDAHVRCILDSHKCSPTGVYRLVVGLSGVGPQAVIGSESGLLAGTTKEKFTLTAPDKAGMYQIRFRPVEAYSKATALEAWQDQNGNEPNAQATIGVIVVIPDQG